MTQEANSLILGCGYLGRQVARLLLDAGVKVVCTNRTGYLQVKGTDTRKVDCSCTGDLASLAELIDSNSVILHSIPLIHENETLRDYTGEIVSAIRDRAPKRMVYISTTGVYGDSVEVDEYSSPDPKTPREAFRVEAEQAVVNGPWSSLVLRPAAIYGPWRGVHASLRAGTFQLSSDRDQVTSRIHVDDLARLTVAALFANTSGAFPVADQHPCPSRETADYCLGLMDVPPPATVPTGALAETRRTGRKVDGSAIFKALGIGLLYPSYREGIPACLAFEAAHQAAEY